jgi:hypothetical protein
MNICSRIGSALALICCSYALSSFAADAVSGKVRNQTTNKPAAGDEVVLLRLENGMEQESATRTDAQGSFVLPMSVANAKHVIRVLHKGVNYDQGLNAKGPLEISVFDTVARIQNLQAAIGMAQVESDGRMLKITEMYAISNESMPPVTQARARNFEISISPNATLDSVVARKDGGVWVNVTPVPIQGRQVRYAVDFPIRPGGTLFKFVYHLPYAGPTTLRVRPGYPVKSFAVMHTPSLTFKSSVPRAFTSPGLAQGLQVEQVVGKRVVRAIPDFEVSGIGIVPRATQAGNSSTAVGPSLSADSRGAASPPAASATMGTDRQETRMWEVLSGVIALLAASLYAFWKRRRNAVSRS